MFADYHSFEDFVAGADEESAAELEVFEAVGGGDAGFFADHGATRAREDFARPGAVA